MAEGLCSSVAVLAKGVKRGWTKVYLGQRMCGRFLIPSPPEALRRIFGYLEQPNFPPRHNIAPTQPVPVVIIDNEARHFRLMRWGLIPSWVKDPRKITLLINARSETVED